MDKKEIIRKIANSILSIPYEIYLIIRGLAPAMVLCIFVFEVNSPSSSFNVIACYLILFTLLGSLRFMQDREIIKRRYG